MDPGSILSRYGGPLVVSARRGAMNPAMLSDFAQRLAAGVSIPSLVTDVGYPCSTNKETFKYVLRLNPAFDEATLAHLLSAVARSHVGLDSTGVNFAR